MNPEVSDITDYPDQSLSHLPLLFVLVFFLVGAVIPPLAHEASRIPTGADSCSSSCYERFGDRVHQWWEREHSLPGSNIQARAKLRLQLCCLRSQKGFVDSLKSY